MAVTVSESIDSPRISGGVNTTVDLSYVVTGTASDTDAIQAVIAASPAYYDPYGTGILFLPRELPPSAEPVPSGDASGGPIVWRVTVRYSRLSSANDPEYSFDTSGGSQHITCSRATVARYPATAPDNKQAIGQTDTSIDGVDIAVPVFNFAETHFFYDSAITDAYKRTLFSLTGCVNSLTYKGYSPGELLFMGASGSKRGDGVWAISFRFSASPNRSNFTVGGISVAAKRGWDYLWVRYKETMDTVNKVVSRVPLGVYIEQVYDLADLSALGI